jgi:hypothetical protein
MRAIVFHGDMIQRAYAAAAGGRRRCQSVRVWNSRPYAISSASLKGRLTT